MALWGGGGGGRGFWRDLEYSQRELSVPPILCPHFFEHPPPPMTNSSFSYTPPPQHPPHRNEKNVLVLVTDQHWKNRQLHLSTHGQRHLRSDVTHLIAARAPRLVRKPSYTFLQRLWRQSL